MTDPISDYLTRLRNAIMAKHRVVEIPASNIKKEMTKILFEKGYILNYMFDENGPQGTIKIALKYDVVSKKNAIKHLERVSRPVCVVMLAIRICHVSSMDSVSLSYLRAKV